MLSTTHPARPIAPKNEEDSHRASSSRPETLLTVKEVAELLRVPVSWVYDPKQIREDSNRNIRIRARKQVNSWLNNVQNWS
jgi:hypothetical protein